MAKARIRTISESAATGELADLYSDIRAHFPGGVVPDIFEILSQRPDFLRVVWAGYRTMFEGGVLPRDVKEMIAVVVSRTNSCGYCVQAHSLLLRSVGGGSSETVAAAAEADIDALPIAAAHRLLLHHAVKLTRHAYRITDEDHVVLRDAGLSEEEILEGVFVASLFNAINRLADTFGLHNLMQHKEGGTQMASTSTSLKGLFEQRASEIEQLTAGITEEQANRRPAEGEWCARDVLTHLLGSETRSFEEGVRAFLEKDAVLDLTPGDPYPSDTRKQQSAQELSAGVVKQVRQIAQFVGALTPDQLKETAHVAFLKNYGVSEYPTLETWAGLMANMHLPQHVGQLRELCK